MKTKTARKPLQPRMSDAAVKVKTGKVWNDWFSLLDKEGARKLAHKEIAELLSAKHGVGPWWSQMVTVTYEQAQGLRDKHEKPEGYQISVSRTLATPLAKLYKSFANEKSRKSWLEEEGLQVRKATPNKSMRVTWSDGKSSLEINFYRKDAKKSQVVVQHSKLANDKAAAKMKRYWSKALDRLKEFLES
jgi:uncharacterized protein YndB with AHSA1/START domain